MKSLFYNSINNNVQTNSNIQIKPSRPKIPSTVSELQDYLNIYRISELVPIEKINGGSFGAVFKAKFRKKIVILKIYIVDRNTCYIQEHKILSQLKHHNIISLYSYYSQAGIIMEEYAPYGDLNHFKQKYIQKGLCQSLLCYFTKDILEGLKFCHQNKIVHMDIKPANILINKNMDATLGDFSISVNYGKLELNQMNYNKKEKNKIKLPCSGTIYYMSPEVLNGDEILIEDINKVDVFSLGILLYQQAYKKFPYNLQNLTLKEKFLNMNAYNKIQNEVLSFPEDKHFSYPFRNFLEGILEKDINKRLSIEEALNHPWVKGAEILFNEKEKIGDITAFTLSIMTDSILNFQKYILKLNNEFIKKYINTDVIYCVTQNNTSESNSISSEFKETKNKNIQNLDYLEQK